MTTRNLRMFGGALAAAFLLAAFPAAQRPATGGMVLTGTITSADGKPLEGVAVSARAAERTVTTSVFTNQTGNYTFPAMAPAKYTVWAQAVGFEAARADLDLSGGRPGRRDLRMRALDRFDLQLTGEEWLASLPEETPADQRMKRYLMSACSSCHQLGIVLQNRFDASGWGNIVDLMARTGPLGGYSATRPPAPVIQEYRDELVEFLTRHRGPSSPPLKYKLAPRPQGEATNAVVTEYDLPPGEAQDYFSVHNGSDWSRGTPSGYEGRSAHDLAITPDGNVWFTDQGNPERTIGMVDVRTGKVKGWKLARQTTAADQTVAEGGIAAARPATAGVSVGTHGIVADTDGNVWFTNQAEGAITKFVPRSEEFVRYPRPAELGAAGGILEIDSKGNIWNISRNGVIKLDPKTGTYTEYKSKTPGDYYGLAIDSQDNIWWTQLGKDLVGYLDTKTGEVGEMKVPPPVYPWLTDKDREAAKKYASNDGSALPQVKGPRRMDADRAGDDVWVAHNYGDVLMRINSRTKAVKEYPMPRLYMQPYDIVVDKKHLVWLLVLNTDRLLRFDPTTEKYTEFLLPTRGTEIRHIRLDERGTSPTVWMPYWRANKIASLQVR